MTDIPVSKMALTVDAVGAIIDKAVADGLYAFDELFEQFVRHFVDEEGHTLWATAARRNAEGWIDDRYDYHDIPLAGGRNCNRMEDFSWYADVDSAGRVIAIHGKGMDEHCCNFCISFQKRIAFIPNDTLYGRIDWMSPHKEAYKSGVAVEIPAQPYYEVMFFYSDSEEDGVPIYAAAEGSKTYSDFAALIADATARCRSDDLEADVEALHSGSSQPVCKITADGVPVAI